MSYANLPRGDGMHVSPSDNHPIDIRSVLRSLATKRPVFHSEADFQHALASEIHERYRDGSIRLEYRVPQSPERMYVDIWVVLGGKPVPMELKYKTRGLKAQHDGETFDLQNHGAQVISRYDVVKDVSRLERVCGSTGTAGYAILLSNDSAYWSSAESSQTVDAAFRLHKGESLHGVLDWAPHTGEGTKKGRHSPITIEGTYLLHWEDYSRLTAGTRGTFRYLLVEVKRD